MPGVPRAMPALVTPFDRDGELRLDDHRHNVATLTAAGVAGFLIGGSTGEGPYLEPGERRRLLTAAREVAPESYLLCGVAGQSVRQAVAHIDEAAAGGADAALVLTPVSLVLGDDGAVVGYYRSLLAASPLPLLIYTLARVTGYVLPVEAVIELAGEDRIVGIKDSTGELDRIAAMRSGIGSAAFAIYSGASRVLVESMQAGATGAITASANYAMPLVETICSGTPQQAEPAQAELRALVAVVESFGLPGTKAAATLTGLRAGEPRAPLRPLDEARRDLVERALATRAR